MKHKWDIKTESVIIHTDLKMACNKVSHAIISKIKAYGIGIEIRSCIKDWLANRKIRLCSIKWKNTQILEGNHYTKRLSSIACLRFLSVIHISDLEWGLTINSLNLLIIQK